MALPINVMWDSGVDALEERAIVDGLVGALSCIGARREVRIFGSKAWSEGSYSSADWYVSHTRRLRRSDGNVQLDADRLLDLLAGEPYQKAEPHIDVMFVSQDLTARDGEQYLSFVFGIASGRLTVQSVARYRDVTNQFERMMAIRMVIQHELGHVFGMAADLRRSNTEYDLGPHCTNRGCVMRQALTVYDWIRHAQDSQQAGMVYCPQCLADAKLFTL